MSSSPSPSFFFYPSLYILKAASCDYFFPWSDQPDSRAICWGKWSCVRPYGNLGGRLAGLTAAVRFILIAKDRSQDTKGRQVIGEERKMPVRQGQGLVCWFPLQLHCILLPFELQFGDHTAVCKGFLFPFTCISA